MATLRTCRLETPLGGMVAAAVEGADGGDGVCLLEFDERRALNTERRELERAFGCTWPEPERASGVLARLESQLAAYFGGTRREFDLPLVTPGTPFLRRVWAELQRIPYGKTVSYATLARRVKSIARATGQANGRNRIAIVVPCHRVIEQDGGLGGYGGKLWRKERLLELEGALEPSLIANRPQ